jgi:hypothetical protein
LATLWNFEEKRIQSIQEIPLLEEKLDSISKIELARESKVPEWVKKEYIQLSIRLKPLAASEIEVLGSKATSAISRARQAIFARRIGLTRSLTPPLWMGGSFWHAGCWTVLVGAWDKTLELSKEVEFSKDESPAGGFLNNSPAEVLEDQIRTWKAEAEETPRDKTLSARKLCTSCESVGLHEDEWLAVRALKSEPDLDIKWE